MGNLITMDGKYQTRGSAKYPSCPVRILATDMKGMDGTVIGLITEPNGWEYPVCWKADGKSLEMGVVESTMDLIPRRRQAWAWVSDDGRVLGFCDRTRMLMEASCEPNEHVRLVTWED